MRTLPAFRAPRGLSLCALLAVAPVAFGQVELTREGGTLGAPLTYTLEGPPFVFGALFPSLNTGPTPLAWIDPADPRVLDVGIDLSGLWVFGVLDGAGELSTVLPLPPSPALVGLVLHAQGLTLPGAGTLVDDLSNRTSVTLGLPDSSVFTPAPAPAVWDGHSATTLPDGRVLIAGGATTDDDGFPLPANGLHLYDPQSGAFTTLAATLVSERVAHTATLLADGRVLIVGGTDPFGAALATCEVVDPLAGTSTSTQSLSEPRVAHTATLLTDGRVFVAGGTQNFDFADPLGALLDVLPSTRVWNPLSGAWTNGPNLPARRLAHAATRLADGRVLVTGGLVVNVIFGLPLPAISNDCRLYNPATNTFSSAAGFSGARGFHGQTLLPDGRVLVVGGADGDVLTQNFFTRADCHVYTAASNSWSAFGSLTEARAYAQVNVAGNGLRVVVSGGVSTIDLAGGGGAPAATIQAAALPGGGWSAVGSALWPRPVAPAVPIDGGRRVLTTGSDTTAEQFVAY